MSTKQPTPETDEKAKFAHHQYGYLTTQSLIDFARTLERERDEARAGDAQDQDHGAAIEAAACDCSEELGHPLGVWDRDVVLRHMRALVATVTNSQQKAEGYHRISDVANRLP